MSEKPKRVKSSPTEAKPNLIKFGFKVYPVLYSEWYVNRGNLYLPF